MSDRGLTHIDPLGRARMVDVTPKEATHRRAVARCRVHMESDTASKIASGAISKGDVLAVARVAGIMGAKRTPELIPLCHPLPVESVEVDFDLPSFEPAEGEERVRLRVKAVTTVTGKTGVEMEALTAAAAALLTIYDMVKAVDRGMTLTDVRLEEKHGGKSGAFRRAER